MLGAPAVTLALLRGGAPNDEVLRAKDVEELMEIASRHNVALPAELINSYLSSMGADEEVYVHRDTKPQAEEEAPAIGSSPALSRARAWRYQVLEQEQEEQEAGQRSQPGSPQPPSPGVHHQPQHQPQEDEAAEHETHPSMLPLHASATGEAISEEPSTPREVGVYEGERDADGRRQGQGTVWYENGIVYVGEWANNVPEGLGKIVYATGEVFEGSFKNGAREGPGTFAYFDGRREVATFANGSNNGGEGAMWSADNRMAWRIVQDGAQCEEISMDEAEKVAERVGQAVPGRFWRETRCKVADPPLPIGEEPADVGLDGDLGEDLLSPASQKDEATTPEAAAGGE